MNYLATFHTHLAALRTAERLKQASLPARMLPVPRRLSSSCGTCVRYAADTPRRDLLDADLEAVYQADGEAYILLFDNP